MNSVGTVISEYWLGPYRFDVAGAMGMYPSIDSDSLNTYGNEYPPF